MIVNITGAVISAIFTSFDARFNEAFALTLRESFVDKIATSTTSSTKTQVYPWMGKIPAMRKWAGPRQPANLLTHGVSITNDLYEVSIKVTRSEIEDDQFGIYGSTAAALGAQSSRLYDQILADILMEGDTSTYGNAYDGLTFFHTQHLVDGDTTAGGTYANKITSTPLTFEGLDVAATAMRRFKGVDGKSLGLKPKYLLVPPSLEGRANELMNARSTGWSKVSSGATAGVGATDNPWQGRYEVVVVDDIDADTAIWYLAADPRFGLSPFIKQVRQEVQITSVVDPSDAVVMMTDEFVWGARARGACGYNVPQAIIRMEG